MSQQTSTVNPWTDEKNARFLRLRMKSFWNIDYFEKIILPLLDLPNKGFILDVGCGNGGISFLLSELRPDLMITGVDFEPKALQDAASHAEGNGFKNIKFEQGDAHQLRFDDAIFDGVVCQTVLTHVRDAQTVVKQMARVLKPGGVFFAAEYSISGAVDSYDNVHFSRRDEAWKREYFRISQYYIKGKQLLERGDETIGVRVPLLATQAGMDVYDVRLNDRVMYVFPPYHHEKQRDYLELTKIANAPDTDGRWLRLTIERVIASGGTEQDGRWYYEAIDRAKIVQAIEDGNFTATSSYTLYLTFARKP